MAFPNFPLVLPIFPIEINTRGTKRHEERYELYCFLLVYGYYIAKGVIHQRTRNFLETPYFHAVPVRRRKAVKDENFNKTVLLKF